MNKSYKPNNRVSYTRTVKPWNGEKPKKFPPLTDEARNRCHHYAGSRGFQVFHDGNPFFVTAQRRGILGVNTLHLFWYRGRIHVRFTDYKGVETTFTDMSRL